MRLYLITTVSALELICMAGVQKSIAVDIASRPMIRRVVKQTEPVITNVRGNILHEDVIIKGASSRTSRDERHNVGTPIDEVPKVIWSYWSKPDLSLADQFKAWWWRNESETSLTRSISELHPDSVGAAEAMSFDRLDGITPYLELCQISWKQLNPGYEIRILNSSSVWYWLDHSDLPVAFESMGSSAGHYHAEQAVSDAVRLAVLKKYGGVWMDASILALKPLNQILGESRPWFMSRWASEKVIESWFLAALPQDPLISSAHDCFTSWHRKRSENAGMWNWNQPYSFEESGLFTADQLKIITASGCNWDYLAIYACFIKARTELPKLWSTERTIDTSRAEAISVQEAGATGTIDTTRGAQALVSLVGSFDSQLATSLTSEQVLLMKVHGGGDMLNHFTLKELACWNHTLKQVLFLAGIDPQGGCDREVKIARPRVVVTLTSTGTPERMDSLRAVLESIANQTRSPDRIILTIPSTFHRGVGADALSGVAMKIANKWTNAFPTLTVLEKPDYGPATKLLGALDEEKHPDTILVVVDDDVLYHEHMVETLVSTMLTAEIDIAPTFKGESICNFWRQRTQVQEPGVFNGYADGYGGVAYRVRYFDNLVWHNNGSQVPNGCFYHDDVWISGSMLKASRTRPYVVPAGFDSVRSHPSFQNDSIHVLTAEHSKDLFSTDLQRSCELFFEDLC